MSKKAPWLRKVAAAGKEFHSRKQDPKRHNRINLLSAAAIWGSVVAIFAMGALVPDPYKVLWMIPAGLLLGCIFLGHFVLIVHECSHNMFLLSEDREKQARLNHRIGRFTAGMMFTDYVRHWEEGHNIHHTRPCEDDDPQDRDPLTGKELYIKWAKIWLIPFYVMATNPSNQYGFNPRRIAGGIAFFAPFVALAWLTVGWQGALAIYIGFSFLSTLNFVKKAQEHGGGLKFEPLPILRSRTYLYPLAFFTSPFNINYHFEHHANCNVPWYLLPEYHTKLVELVPEPLRPYYFHSEFWKQIAGNKPLPPEELRGLIFLENKAQAGK